ncbi:membrane protein [Lapidilactobacillus concavus DSM 17758]|uniref:Membrane protein n=1 Tax=Lapidilactobacillus concavus DSM 17758 TaxID=1423735 RepID=A0A0R1VQ35_9LACO|nr:ABC transporter permease [Lapidilactobacillus concavus]KRM07863.1 membrane protein [Lapidilactobacillus concavus DSM 17758]GEL13579.1 ABC transporter permease [Lapidilactobacillus concavus]
MSKFKTVFRQVYLKNLRSGSFIWMVVAPLVIMLVGGLVGFFVAKSQEDVKMAIVTPQAELQPTLQQLKVADLKVDHKIKTQAAAKKALSQQKIDGYAVVTTVKDNLKVAYVSRTDGQDLPSTALDAQFTQLNLQFQANRLKLSQSQLQELLQPTVTTHQVVSFEDGQQVDRNQHQRVINVVLATAVAVIMMMFIMSYAGMIASEVASEKGTRIMEIILSSIDVKTQFLGKICGIFALIVTQLVVYGVLFLAGRTFLNQYLLGQYPQLKTLIGSISLPSIWSAQMLLTIAFFIVGILTYTIIAAMLGSLVSAVEQVQQVVTPISFFAIFAYILGLMAANGSDNILVRVAAYVPLISPIVMPARLATEAASGGEALLSLAISIVAMGLGYFLSLTLYRANVLVYSDGNIWQAMRHSFRILTNRKKRQG